MSEVASDLESMIAFHEHLRRFKRTLAVEFSSVRGHWQNLGDVWTDAKYHEFDAEWARTERGIDRILARIQNHETSLAGLIKVLEKYAELVGDSSITRSSEVAHE
jgi:hypothetical protein